MFYIKKVDGLKIVASIGRQSVYVFQKNVLPLFANNS